MSGYLRFQLSQVEARFEVRARAQRGGVVIVPPTVAGETLWCRDSQGEHGSE